MADRNLFDEVLNEVETGAFSVTPEQKPRTQLPSMFEETLADAQRGVQQQRNVAITQGLAAKPDEYQAHKSIAEAFGVSTEFAARNAEALKTEHARVELDGFLTGNPAIAEWYAQGDNPASIKIDELRQLSGLSWLWGAAGAAITSGQQTGELARLRSLQLQGKATPEDIARANEMSLAREPRSYGADNWLSQGWVGAFEQGPQLFYQAAQSIQTGLQFGTAAAGVAAVAGQIGPQVAVPEEILTVPGAYAGGFAVGTTWGAWKVNFDQQSALAFDEFLMMRDENGNPLDEDTARTAALVAGMGGSLLETAADVTLARLIPGVDRLLGGGSTESIKAALREPSVREAMKNFGVNTLKAGATEVTTEVAQEAVNIFVGEVTKAYANTTGAEFEALTPDEIGARLGDAAVETAKVMTILGPVLSGTRLGSDLMRAREATQTTQMVEALLAHAEGNAEMIKRVPEKVRDAVETLTKDGQFTSVYIDPEGLTTYFQTAEEVTQFAEQVGLREEVAEAVRLGRRIEIPIETYYASIASTEIGQALKEYTAFRPDSMTGDEATGFNEAWGAARDALFSDYEAQQADRTQALEGEERVFAAVRDMVQGAGITPDQAQQYAKLYSTFFRVLGERTGQDAMQVYERYGLEFRRVLPDMAEYRPVNQLELDLSLIRSGKIEGMRRTVEKAGGPSLLDFVRDAGGIEEQSGELAAMDLPKRLRRPERSQTGDMVGGGNSENSLDAMARRAWESGYFEGERPTPNQMLDALRAELAGDRVYSREHDRRQDAEIQRQAGLVAFADGLAEAGIDVAGLTDDEVRAEIDRVVAADPEAGAMFQAAWHGTPHTFDRFSTDHIGSGEGNQAYGWGLYFSSSEKISKWYRDQLTKKARVELDGQKVSPDAEGGIGLIAWRLDMWRNKVLPSLAKLRAEYARQLANPALHPDARRDNEEAVALIDAGRVKIVAADKGRLFQVEVPEDAELLNWDAPLSDQPVGLLEQIERAFASIDPDISIDTVAEVLDQDPSIATFGQYYKALHETLEVSDKAISQALRDNGIPGHRYVGGGSGITNYVVYDDSRVSVTEYFQREQQSTTDTKRGSIQFGEGRTIINLFEAADLSTVLHESAHFFLQVFNDVATQGDPALAQDWTDLKEFLGIDADGVLTEAAHEKFARSFEAYLFEGKTPSVELADIFSRFRSWLVFVYKQVEALRAPINAKVRGIMDRMLATDADIASMQTAPEFRPMFKDAAEAGMTPEQWASYTASAQRAVDRAKREMDVRLMGEVARQTTSEWREAKAEIRKAVREEYEALPAYRALSYLRTGNTDGLPDGTPAYKLSRDGIVSIMGEGALLRLPKGVPPIYRTKDGVHPDAVAELLGFKSGSDMLTALMSAPPLGRAINEEVAVRMRQRFGDLMGDANARIREAEAAIANDETGELLQAEIEVLVRKGLVNTRLNRQSAQRAARAAVRAKPVREAVRFRLYMNANAKAAAAAEKAVLKGDWKTALAEKQKQLLNHYMAMEARQAQIDADKAVTYLSKFTGKKRPKGITADYLEQIDGLLERFDMRRSVSTIAAQRRQALSAWITDQEAQGLLVSIPDVLRNDAFRKPYREMTVDDLTALQDTVKSVEHLGRLKDKLLANKAAREFEATRDEVLASIMVNQEMGRVSQNQNPVRLEQGLSLVKSLDASMLKIEQVLSWLDGGDINGPLRRHVWQPIADAEVRENDLRVQYVGKIFDIMGALDPKRLAERITVAAVDTTFTRSEIMAVALNLGNVGNREKMMKAGNGRGPWTQQDIDAIIQHLSEAEWQAVQNLWDTINELWPEIAALQKRLSGVEPPKVEAAEVQTPFGTLKGGYYPLIYDPRRAPDVADRQAANADKLFENTYLKPETLHGFTKERTKAYSRPLLFDLDRAGSHIVAVIHDLTHREAIMDAHKLLTDQDVRSEIESRYGREVYQQFVPWLQSIAHDNVRNDGLEGMNKVLRGIRSRATMVGMGFRISTILTQVVGLSSSLEMVQPRHMATGLGQFIANPMAAWRMVEGMSGEMRHRGNQLDRDIRDEMRRLSGKHGPLDEVRRFAFHGIGFMDKVVTVPTWIGAYTQHLASYPGDTPGAVAAADSAIRLTQGGGGAKDLAAVQRNNEGVKLITMFYSYFSAYYNRQRNWGRAAKKAIQNGTYQDFPQLLAQQVFMTIGPAVLADLIVGKGPAEDEPWEQWAAKKIALYPFMTLPLIRDALNATTSGFGYSFSPAGRTVQELVLDPILLVGKIAEGKATPREVVNQVLNSTGYALNLPTGQLASTVNNVWKAIDEDDFQLRDLVVSRNN